MKSQRDFDCTTIAGWWREAQETLFMFRFVCLLRRRVHINVINKVCVKIIFSFRCYGRYLGEMSLFCAKLKKLNNWKYKSHLNKRSSQILRNT